MGKKKKKQEPLIVNAPFAFISATNLLYIAQKLALENKDRAALIDIANAYIDMGTQLLVHETELVYDESEGTVEEQVDGKNTLIGFTGGIVDGEEEAEPPEEPAEDRSGIGF